MSEFYSHKVVRSAAAGLLGALILAGCSSSEKPAVSKKSPSTISMPPLARPHKAFDCQMATPPESLAEAGLPEPQVAETLSPIFHQSVAAIDKNARYGLAYCQRSISANMAKSSGFVVDVPNIASDYSCITWSVIYSNEQQAKRGGPTDHIGLICVPALAPSTY